MSPLFIASHPAIDFINTALAPNGQPIECIGDGASFVDWLGAAGLLSPAEVSKASRRFGVQALDRAATEARAVRGWARDWIGRWRVAPNADYTKELRRLNELLARAPQRREVESVDGSLRLVERTPLDSPDALIGRIAAQIADLLTTEQPALVKPCAGAGCTLWFLDRTKAHRRLFCSAAACGNRAKVAAFRERQRQVE